MLGNVCGLSRLQDSEGKQDLKQTKGRLNKLLQSYIILSFQLFQMLPGICHISKVREGSTFLG